MEDCIGEAERLRQLAELAIIEAPIDPLMERICALACSLLQMPMAFVTVLDATQAHIKAQQGLGYITVPREDVFCDWTIRGDQPLVVGDLAADPRFSDNPLVAGASGFRFYAGIPLSLSPGVRIGALCVADRAPRDLRPTQVECLQNLAALVLGQLRHHAVRQELARHAIEIARKQGILAQTAKLAKVGGFELDPATGTVTLSDELARLLAANLERTVGLDGFIRLFPADARGQLREGLAQLSGKGASLDLEAPIRGRHGKLLHVRVHAERLKRSGDAKIVGIVQDISERKAAIGKLEWLASHDVLTRVCNRASFSVCLDAAIRRADATGRRAALIMVDVDRFKAVNDTLGHDAGDAVLVAVAQRLVAVVGERGTVARLGGDEFGVLIDEVDTESDVAGLASGMLAAIRQPLAFAAHELSPRASLGVALSDEDPTCSRALLKNADIALYEAKKTGRERFAVFRPAMRVEMEDRIDRLTAQAEREARYQPKSRTRAIG